jgi:hypothetical protein
MTDNEVRAPRRIAIKVALVGAGLAGGVVLATAFGAAAGTTSGTGSTSTPAAGTTQSTTAPNGGSATSGAPNGRTFDHGGSAPVRSDEHALGAALTAKLKAAALKAVPGGSVYRVESDAGDGTYEAHMTKADGSMVTVKFDKNGNVTKVETGMGAGDPRH